MSIDLPEPWDPRKSRELDSPAAMVDVSSEWSVEYWVLRWDGGEDGKVLDARRERTSDLIAVTAGVSSSCSVLIRSFE